MKERILGGFWSLNGLSLAIAGVGFASGIVTMFIDVNDKVSIKWLILSIISTGIIILILLKITYDLSIEKSPHPPLNYQ